MARPAKVQFNSDDDNAEFPFDPGMQIELEMEDTCCVTGEPVEFSFCRFPDYKNATIMVMSKSAMLAHLCAGDSIAKFKEVLVQRHGEEVLAEHYIDPKRVTSDG